MRRLAVLALCLFACDTAKQSDVDGLQQRLDAIAAQQAALEKQVAALGERPGDDAMARLQADLAKIEAELALLQTTIAKPAVPTPPTPTVRPGSPDPAARYKVTVDDAFARGPADAKVTLVIFSDFQCPFCVRVQPTLKDLQARFGSDLRIVAKHNPLPMHTRAEPAARAAEAAGKQGKFWEMHDKLYENSRELTDENFETWAKELKLDLARFRRDIDDATIQARIDAHQEEARRVGALGTPAFFVNGRFLSGAQPLEKFETLVKEEIAEADRVLARGTVKASLYDTLMATAKEKP